MLVIIIDVTNYADSIKIIESRILSTVYPHANMFPADRTT
jgi:hypothetical protein